MAETKNKVGRPKKEIDPEQVKKLAMLQCTYEEMAGFFECDQATLRRNFATIIKEGKETGKMSLRRYQFELAKKSAAMAIFLGKNYLGQTDNQNVVIQDMPEIVIGIRDNKGPAKDN